MNHLSLEVVCTITGFFEEEEEEAEAAAAAADGSVQRERQQQRQTHNAPGVNGGRGDNTDPRAR